jgi:septum formation protein
MIADGRSLILASSSRYRRALLENLGLPFTTAAPNLDESPHTGETAERQVLRLARLKAGAVAAGKPDALVIGSDQLAVCEGQVLGKPGCHERALAQLRQLSGRTVTFHTGLCLLDSATGREQVARVPFEVRFRALEDATLERYLRREQPYDCAGSFKSEGLGITLFRWLRGDDPSALIGLPLIALVTMLEAEGVQLP